MSWLTQSIRNKLLLIVGVASALTLAAAFWGLWSGARTAARFETLLDTSIAQEEAVLKLQTLFKMQVQEWKDVLLRGKEPAAMNKYWHNFQQDESAVQSDGEALLGKLTDAEARNDIRRFLDAHRAMGKAYRKGLNAFKDSGFDRDLGDAVVKGIDRAPTEVLSAAAEHTAGLTAARVKGVVDNAKRDRVISVATLLVAMVLSMVLFLWTVKRTVVRPAQQLVVDLEALAGGRFDHSVTVSTEDELGQVARSACNIQERIGTTVRDMVSSVSSLVQMVEKLNATAEHLQNQVGSQRSESERIAAASNEMNSSIQEVAHSVASAMHASQEANGKAQHGQQVVGSTIDAIGAVARAVDEVGGVIAQLEKEGGNIGSVLDVINGVAEQTNLLALNAAIEAARAGEQGRGFAVVADEVRTLAQRTQASTKEIQEIIERLRGSTQQAVKMMGDSRASVDTSVAQADRAGVALEEISAAVGAISDMSTQIAATAEEQTVVAEEISHNIHRVSDAARNSADGIDEITSVSAEIAQVATRLSAGAQRFRV